MDATASSTAIAVSRIFVLVVCDVPSDLLL